MAIDVGGRVVTSIHREHPREKIGADFRFVLLESGLLDADLPARVEARVEFVPKFVRRSRVTALKRKIAAGSLGPRNVDRTVKYLTGETSRARETKEGPGEGWVCWTALPTCGCVVHEPYVRSLFEHGSARAFCVPAFCLIEELFFPVPDNSSRARAREFSEHAISSRT